MSFALAIPFVSAFFYGVGSIFQKLMLKKRNMDAKLYQVSVFIAIVVFMLPFVYFFGHFSSQALSFWNITIMVIIVVLSLIANYLLFMAVKMEKVTNVEPTTMVEPLFIVIVAVVLSFFFPNDFERNLNVVIPTVIASAALIFSHVRRHHLKFNKYFAAVLIATFLFAVEVTLSKLILDYYNPISFYFVRSLLIAVAGLLVFKPKLNTLNGKVSLELLGLGAIFVFYRVLLYYGFMELGVIFTTLVAMVGPLFVYVLAWKFLKEKLDWRNMVSSGIILACVLYAILA